LRHCAFSFRSKIAGKHHPQVIAAIARVEGFARLVHDRFCVWIRSIRLQQSRKLDGLNNVSKVGGTADARMRIALIATGVITRQVPVFPAYLIGGVIACLNVVLLEKYLESEIPRKGFGFASRLLLAQFLGEIQYVLR
jgi:hypothetical protein